jgi:hypothetical protein
MRYQADVGVRRSPSPPQCACAYPLTDWIRSIEEGRCTLWVVLTAFRIHRSATARVLCVAAFVPCGFSGGTCGAWAANVHACHRDSRGLSSPRNVRNTQKDAPIFRPASHKTWLFGPPQAFARCGPRVQKGKKAPTGAERRWGHLKAKRRYHE